MNKCPKCGKNIDVECGGIRIFFCGTEEWTEEWTEGWTEGEKIRQSEECKIRCELADLKERHQRLVEAAMEAVKCYDSRSIVGITPVFETLRKCCESEAKQ